MRVAYVANSRIPSRAANTVHVLNMSAAFAAAGADVALIAREGQQAQDVLKKFGVEGTFQLSLATQKRPALLDKLHFIHFIRRKLRKFPVDLAYGRSCYGLLFGVPKPIPVVYDMHTHYADGRLRRLEALLFRRPNFLFATSISQALARQYESDYPALRGRIMIAPCGANPRQRLAEAGRETGPLRIYYVGHLYPGKGVELVIRIAALLPDAEFHVVGGEEADIAALSGAAPANVIFHGYTTPAGLENHYQRADICLAPYQDRVAAAGGHGDISRWMSPMKIFEYMSHGRAIVASDLPVLREVLVPEKNCLLCPPDDAPAWRDAIERLASDGALRVRLAERGRREAEEKYSWTARARTILAHARQASGKEFG